MPNVKNPKISHIYYVTTATHNFKWVKNTHICLIWDLETFEDLDS